MDKLIIRHATQEDMRIICSIYAHEVLHGLATFEEHAPDLDEISMRRKAIVGLGFPYLVAEVSGLVVGYAYASTYRPRPAYRRCVENSVYVDINHRGYGVGRRLLENLVEQCEQSGLRQMIAVIGDSRNVGSIALHTGLGFRHVGILHEVGFKFGRWVDTVIMQRQLGGGNLEALVVEET
jgi:phosphinothricin acetyltransferase